MGLFSKVFGSQPTTQSGSASGKRILLVDDSITIQRVVELTLTPHRVTAATSLAEATSLLGRERFDAVISAVVLPDGTGYNLCRHAKSLGVPVILMPGSFEPFDQAQANSAGADAVVSKPFQPKDLIAAVDQLPLKH